jgi:mono/diheme cytochrome c family protein
MIKKINTLIFLLLFLIFGHCGPETDKKTSIKSKIKFKQYYNNGKRLYVNHCSNCHQKDGSGLVRLYPPIQNSDYFILDFDRTICIIKNGLEGEIFVNSISFNQPMPANDKLTHLEIAELVTYLYSTWGDEHRMVQVEEVSKILNKCTPSPSK